jgi:hypothetical protein
MAATMSRPSGCPSGRVSLCPARGTMAPAHLLNDRVPRSPRRLGTSHRPAISTYDLICSIHLLVFLSFTASSPRMQLSLNSIHCLSFCLSSPVRNSSSQLPASFQFAPASTLRGQTNACPLWSPVFRGVSELWWPQFLPRRGLSISQSSLTCSVHGFAVLPALPAHPDMICPA